MCNNKKEEGVKNSNSSSKTMEEAANLKGYFTTEQKKKIYDSIIELATNYGQGEIILETIKKCSDAVEELHKKVGKREDSNQYAGMVALAIICDLPIDTALVCIDLMKRVVATTMMENFIETLFKK